MDIDALIKLLLDDLYDILVDIEDFDNVIYYAQDIREVCNAPITWYNQDFDEKRFQQLADDLDDEIRSLSIEHKFLLELHGVEC